MLYRAACAHDAQQVKYSIQYTSGCNCSDGNIAGKAVGLNRIALRFDRTAYLFIEQFIYTSAGSESSYYNTGSTLSIT
ncbi:hypothetical protein D3C73_665180 [compost metagenome]